MSDDTVKGTPWGRQPGETPKAYEGFCAYIALGSRRSIRLAIESTGTCATLGRQRNWEKWSSKYRWVDRATSYDTHLLEKQMQGRELVIERARQEAFDAALDMWRELREISKGNMRPGQQMVQTDRDGVPRMATVTGPDGEPMEVAITKELVPPKVRADILIKGLAYAGIVEPVKGHIDFGVKGAAEGLRAALRELDPDVLRAIADAMGGSRGDAR